MGILNQKVTAESSTALETLGKRYVDVLNNKEYIYCVDSGSALAQYKPAAVTQDGAAALLTTANALTCKDIVVPQIAVTASYYFWGLVKGTGTVHVASACASAVPLFTTSVAGRMDDAVAVGVIPIHGIQLTEVAATAAASANATCWLNNPTAATDSATRSLAYSG